MIFLHSADWHLGAPLQSRTDAQADLLRKSLLAIPGQIAALCRAHRCDLLLLSGDLFDGPCSADTVRLVQNALRDAAIPVFIAPGNHDHMGPGSPYSMDGWPENVTVFRENRITSVAIPELDCRIYGAAFTSRDCSSLLEGFSADATQTHQICILHGDPTQTDSPYCPVTRNQILDSGLSYLALGHIHKGGQFTVGRTLCAWPGCPMGWGYDEVGEKGALLVTLDTGAEARFLPLNGPRFYDLTVSASPSPERAIAALLPPVENQDFYRITLTGECEKPDLAMLKARFSGFPNLELQDRTVPAVDPWASLGEDTFSGAYFARLHSMLSDADADGKRQILLAARISRLILDGKEAFCYEDL